jgi:hypothetical protein
MSDGVLIDLNIKTEYKLIWALNLTLSQINCSHANVRVGLLVFNETNNQTSYLKINKCLHI